MNTAVKTSTPEGYRMNAKGHLVPEDQIKVIDLMRDELVNTMIEEALALSNTIAKFKGMVSGEISDFEDQSASQFGVEIAGKKGNLQLINFNGTLKVERAIADRMSFDEQLQAAKALIDECIESWSEGSDDKIKTLVDDSFQVNKAGKIDVQRILGLRKLNIDDERWNKAMHAIAESIQVVGTATYFRLYQRESNDGKWKQIPLDFSGIAAQKTLPTPSEVVS